MHTTTSIPLKVVLFTAGPMVPPTLSYLLHENRLAGVMLADRRNAVDPGFVAELDRANVPYRDITHDSAAAIVECCHRWEADLGFILGFSRILPADVLEHFQYGVYNLHPAALPDYRGAMPLYWLIRNREPETRLTVHKAEARADSGAIVLQQPLAIHPRDTLYSLSIQVAQQAPVLLRQLLETIEQRQAPPPGEAQQGEPGRAPWPEPADIMVDWVSMPAGRIEAMARAGNPTFGATLVIRNTPVTLLQATAVDMETFGTPPGTLIHIGEPEGLVAAAREGAIRLDILSGAEGVFGGVAFAERFALDAGMRFESPPTARQAQARAPAEAHG